jgi:hypothetical protein
MIKKEVRIKLFKDFSTQVSYNMPYEYNKVDNLFIETPESCLVNCIADWSFLDALL